MEIDILILKLENNLINRRDIPKLRGFIADKYPQYVELHNHIGNDAYRYGYPMIQYKTIYKTPALIAINEAIKVLTELSFDLKEIDINGDIKNINEKKFIIKKEKFGISEKPIKYLFESPWMALNQNNYKKYLSQNEKGKNEILIKILVGNLLSVSKSLSYFIQERVNAELDLTQCTVNFKNQAMIAFKGNFKTNFYIPDYLGLGKSVSRGFGVIKKIEEKQYIQDKQDIT